MRRLALLGVLVLCMGLLSIGTAAGAPKSTNWRPAPTGGLDCNGFSPVQRPVKQGLPCTEIAANDEEGFEDNGHYVGHDEADIGFFSTKHGSGNSASYNIQLPIDPHLPPTGTFDGRVWDFQLRIAPWFGMTMCDNESYPEGTKVCKPDSDSNIQVPPRPNHAGAAFMELQLYPPGHPPFISSISCDRLHWCAALTIDSLQAEYGALHGPGSPPNAVANPNCVEPVNFAFLTKSGHPVGPPGPDQLNAASFTPTPDVLKMNQGDVLTVSMHDTAAGFRTVITDRTTGQQGTMTASVANGFRHILWDPVNFTCQGAPYAFHPMYDTAAPPLPNGQPTAWTTWAAHTDNIAYSAELGHFEPPDGDDDDAGCTAGPLIPGCIGTDFDFDGYSYHPDWPNRSARFPTPNYLTSPRSLGPSGAFDQRYVLTRFETDLPRIEEADTAPQLHCDHHTGQGCTNPPPGAKFYPWYHLAAVPHLRTGSTCAWAASNDLPNQISNFGGEKAAWGPLELTDYGFDLRYHNFARTIRNPCP
jgi:hypothetical protein